MDGDYSNVGAVVGATYPEMGAELRKLMPKAYILVPGYGAQGGSGKDLKGFFNSDGLGAIVVIRTVGVRGVMIVLSLWLVGGVILIGESWRNLWNRRMAAQWLIIRFRKSAARSV